MKITVTESTVELAFELAQQHQQFGQFEQAEDLYRQILTYHPADPMVLLRLGVLTRQQGNSAESAPLLRQALQADPHSAEIQYELAHTLQTEGQWAEAVERYEQAIAERPHFPEAYNGLGITYANWGKRELAVLAYVEAIKLQPDFVAAYNNLGIALHDLGQYAEAQQVYQKALQLDPTFVPAYLGLGVTLQALGNIPEAIAIGEQAVLLRPDSADALNNLGNVLTEGDRLEDAIHACQRAIVLRPDFADAFCNLGNAYKKQGQISAALQAYRRAIELDPNFAEAYSNLGNTRMAACEIEAAVQAFQQAIALQPGLTNLYSNLLYALHFLPDDDGAAIYRPHARWNAEHMVNLAQGAEAAFQAHDRQPNRRLRVGYMAPDFREHCQSFFTVPLLGHHDHAGFEIFCYADVLMPDAVTERLRGYADVWRSTVGLTDEALVERIRGDQIDILVDLTMHMARGRPGVLARRAAPVQVSWLAYPGTTGLTNVQYRITDPYLDPAEEKAREGWYSEESLRLPETFWCYDPLTTDPAVNGLPALEAGGRITLGCLNNAFKINEVGLGIWAQILARLPGARLLLLVPAGEHRARILARLGVTAERVAFVERLPRAEYLRLYHQIDLCIDTFPYNGHTTSLDALWMGVPVVSLCGRTAVARAGYSQLSNLGLPELVAHSPEAYVARVVELAGDLPRLAELRRTLRGRLEASPLMDGARFARNMEDGYRRMWERYVGEK